MKAAGWFQPKAVIGFYPCASHGDDLIVFDPEDPESELETHHIPAPSPGPPSLHRRLLRACEARNGIIQRDVVGFSIVTIGDEASRQTLQLFESGDFTKYLYLHGLSVETAEALAELAHKQARQFLSASPAKTPPRISDLFHQKYRGSRYCFGYPACPNLEDQTKIFRLLKPEEKHRRAAHRTVPPRARAEHQRHRRASLAGEVFRCVSIHGASRIRRADGGA